ncbi:DNA-binding response regulator [Entomomonas moraniae]|uniref:DNA-binding response regulator n=1 Tax=Entomomonas moraniae TaxID=2213226 RepID=A0A3Q9JJQ0_9GAMM|nr:response regulator transcription factor [Entomomonas moraniae]AZS49786.1 DNA-binding response regulator [Entomomonas moraniae]
MKHILVVEDDLKTSEEIKEALQDHGLMVTTALTGRDGLIKALANPYDAIVLDRMLAGGLDGLSVLLSLRNAEVITPVLILSALSQLDERVQGLKAGGDDYLCKPFEFIELTARIDALTRRRYIQKDTEPTSNKLMIGDLEIDLLKREVKRGTRDINLVPREYALLIYLAEHADQVVTKTMLFEAVWQYHYHDQTNVIEVHMGRLRKKIDTSDELSMIQTVRGAGYVLRSIK